MPVVFPPIASGLAALISILSLIGWQFRLAWLREPFGGFMAPNAALSFILLAIVLGLFRWKEKRWMRFLAISLSSLVGIFSVIVLWEHLTSINTGLSQLFLRNRLDAWNIPTLPGRFAPNSALCFVLLAIALIMAYEDGPKPRIEFLTAISLLVSGLAAIGHTYGVRALYSLEIENYMALVTAVAFLLIGGGILFALAPGGWLGVVLRDDAAGLLSRRIFLFGFTVVPLLGWISVHLVRENSLGPAFGTSLLVVTVLVIITSTVFRSAREIRRLERERRATEDQLREAEKLAVTGRLAATLAHEVNNPLEAVTNILYLLDHDSGLSSQSKQFLLLAQEELSRVSHITRQTLAFYREPVAPAVIRPSELVRQTLVIFEPKLRAKAIRAAMDDRMPGEVTFFPGELKQIVTNLLSNAIDATDSGGTIMLRVRAARSWTRLRREGFRILVSDSGSGIDPQDKLRMFQPFFTTKGQKGTGLGLWVTQGLVNKHGGELRLRSRTKGPRRGTTFSVFLPAEVRPVAAEHIVSKSAS